MAAALKLGGFKVSHASVARARKKDTERKRDVDQTNGLPARGSISCKLVSHCDVTRTFQSYGKPATYFPFSRVFLLTRCALSRVCAYETTPAYILCTRSHDLHFIVNNYTLILLRAVALVRVHDRNLCVDTSITARLIDLRVD